MNRNVLRITASAKRTSKDRPNGSAFKPTNTVSPATKFSVKVTDPVPPIDNGTISCAGAANNAIILVLADISLQSMEVPPPRPKLLLEINGREYDVTNVGFPAEILSEPIEDISSFVKPPNTPSNFVIVYAMRISNPDTTETKRIKLTSYHDDSSMDLLAIFLFSTFGNPTGSGYRLMNGRVETTVCLARSTGEVIPPEPVGNTVPDFAFRMNSSMVSATVNDSSGNTYNGLVKSMSLVGMETRFLAKLDNLNPITNLRIDAERKCVEAVISPQVLAGDYIDISVFRKDSSGYYKMNTAQYAVTGAECQEGLAYIPINFIFGGSSEFQPNTRYRFEATVKRGIIGSSTVTVGSGVAELEDVTMYTVNRHRYDGSNLWMSLRYASDYVGAGYKGYKVPLSLGNVALRLSLGSALASNVGGGVYGEPHINTGKMWSYLMTASSNSVKFKIWDSVLDIVQEVVFPTMSNISLKDPNLIISDDTLYATVVFIRGSSGTVDIGIAVTFIRDATTKLYRPLSGDEVPDLSNSPIYANEGTFTDSSTWGNPGGYYGSWSKDLSAFLKIVPPNTPSIYKLVSKQSSGKHVLEVSPSNDSLLAILRQYQIFERERTAMDVRFNYRIFNSGRFLLAWQTQNGSSAFLFECTDDVWELHTVFVTNRLAHVAESVDSYYDKVIVLENEYLITSLGDNIVPLGNDEKFLIYSGEPAIPFMSVTGNVLDYRVYDPSTKTLTKLSIGE